MKTTRDRCIPNDGALLEFDPEVETPRHLSILVSRFPPVVESFQHSSEELGGLFSGPTSIAALFCILRDEMPTEIEGKTPREWAKAYQEVSKSMSDAGPENMDGQTISSKSCGIFVQPLGWAVISAWAYEDDQHLEPVFENSATILQNEDPFDEWVGGRAGYLYILRLARSISPSSAHRIDPIIRATVNAMLLRSPDTENPWYFVNHYYVGLGHGWFGNIAQILLSDPTEPRVRQCRPWLLKLLSLQAPNGLWPLYLNKDGSIVEDSAEKAPPELLEAGHGPPGICACLFAVRPIYEKFNDVEMIKLIDEAIDKAQDLIWTRGILTKESCILNGMAGNSLALTDMKRKATFIALSIQERVDAAYADGSIETSSNPSGLSRGLAGRIWAMAEYKRGRNGVIPTFNDV